MPTPAASPAQRRERARRLLEAFDLEAVERWAATEPRASGFLQSLLFDDDVQLRWRAVEALGRVAAARARRDAEAARELIRRALWLMNDESGGLLWLGPPLIGTVLANVPALCGEFLPILASFLEEEPFRAGTRWALWRVAAVRPEGVAAAAPALVASLADPDPSVRGHAALALAAASCLPDRASADRDPEPFVVFDYRTGAVRSTTVRDAASGRP